MGTIALVDLSSVFYPGYKAAGEDTTLVVPSTVAKVYELIGRLDHVAIAIDSPKSFRRELSAEYKANRVKDAVAKDLIAKVQDRLRADGFPIWGAEGFEADDVLATASLALATRGHVVEILTGDKDLLGTVAEGVTVRSVRTGETFDRAGVVAKLGVTPEQIRDYLALVGDASDNVPGVRGVGPKHAARLLTMFGDVQSMLQRIDEVVPAAINASVRAAYLDGSLPLSQKLVTLRYDVPGIEVGDVLKPRVAATPTAQPDYDGDDDMGNATDDNGRTLATPEDAISPPPTAAPVLTAVPQTASPATPVAAPKSETTAQTATEAAPTNGTALATPRAPEVGVELILPSDPRFAVALEPRSQGQAWRVGQMVVASRIFPRIPNAETATLVIMMGRSLGVDALTMLRVVHIVDGQVCLPAALIVGLVLRSGKHDYFKCIETTNEKATYTTHRKDDPDDRATTLTWTIEDAVTAGLKVEPRAGKERGPWWKQPRTMLRHRCAVELARMVYPDVVLNLYSPEEFDADHVPTMGVAA